MNKENMFYPHSIEAQVQFYFRMEREHGLWVRWFLIAILLPFLVVWLPYCYLCDIVANILDWLCILFFVDLPLWGFKKQEEYEMMYGVKP